MLLLFILIFVCLFIPIWIGNYLFIYSMGRKNKKFLQADLQDLPPPEKKENPVLAAWLSQVNSQEKKIVSTDGLQLYGKIFNQKTSHKWVIAIHGYRGRHTMMASFAKLFYEQGFHVLCPDLRGHGNSQGEYISMGWLDRKDILCWIDFILNIDKDAEIVLFGISMGAATAMMTSGEPMPPQVKCVVEDCGYTSVYDQFSYQLKRMFHLPAFPFLSIARTIARLRMGMDFYDASTVKQIQRNPLPTLFIHGTEDSFVPAHMAEILYRHQLGDKKILLVEGAGHGKAFSTAPELYKKTLFQFIAPYLVSK